MNRSDFFNNDTGECFSATEELSEWLFAEGFWGEVNSSFGSIFDQFEDDVADTNVVSYMIKLLREKLNFLHELESSFVEFQYGWSHDKIPLSCSISKNTLQDELIRLIDFFVLAVGGNNAVTCYL